MTTQAQINFSSQTTGSKDQLLRNTLRANGVFSAVSGLVFIFASAPLADFLGIKDANILGFLNGSSFLIIMGVGLLLYAGGLLWNATRPQMNKMLAWEAVFMDSVWVIGSAIILLAEALPLTTEGSWTVLIIADVVASFAVLQYVGIRRMGK